MVEFNVFHINVLNKFTSFPQPWFVPPGIENGKSGAGISSGTSEIDKQLNKVAVPSPIDGCTSTTPAVTPTTGDTTKK